MNFLLNLPSLPHFNPENTQTATLVPQKIINQKKKSKNSAISELLKEKIDLKNKEIERQKTLGISYFYKNKPVIGLLSKNITKRFIVDNFLDHRPIEIEIFSTAVKMIVIKISKLSSEILLTSRSKSTVIQSIFLSQKEKELLLSENKIEKTDFEIQAYEIKELNQKIKFNLALTNSSEFKVICKIISLSGEIYLDAFLLRKARPSTKHTLSPYEAMNLPLLAEKRTELSPILSKERSPNSKRIKKY